MAELFESPFFGIALSVIAFWIGIRIQKKTGLVACNPLIIAIVLIVGVLLVFRIPYEAYNQGGALINLFLAPATTCLAVSIYTKVELLKQNWLPILVGCAVGSLTSMGSVYALCRLFRLDESLTAALMPKSVTTPIAIAVSQQLGGITSITVAAVIVTGILGAITAPLMARLFRVRDGIAKGVAIGTCSHAVGTTKALEMGELEGAMSGVSIAVSGLLTTAIVIVASCFL